MPRGTRVMRGGRFDAPGEGGPGRTGRGPGPTRDGGSLGGTGSPPTSRPGRFPCGFASPPGLFPTRSGVEDCVQGPFPDRYRVLLHESGI